MKDLVKKVAVGLTTGALIASNMILPAFASIEVIVSGNGQDTTNGVVVNQTNSTTVTQTNTAVINNDVNAVANSGENNADDNSGNVNIDTGAASAVVEVTNTVNNNQAQVGCATCPGDLKVNVSGNVEGSTNTVGVGLANTTWVNQTNSADLNNDIDVKANSGKNTADDNTGEVEIDTDSATAKAFVTNQANANVAKVSGSDDAALLELVISGNGADTKNSIVADLDNLVTVFQDNVLDASNDLWVEAVSGYNGADDNAGNVKIDTGAATAVANTDTSGNFNLADVEACCTFDGKVAITGNVEESVNKVGLDLTNSFFAQQDNLMSCEDREGWPWLLSSEMPWGNWWNKDKECNEVDAVATSGKNDSDDNTGGVNSDPEIDTGSATTNVEVKTEGNANVLTQDNGLPVPPPAWDWDMDGNFSWLVWLFAGMTS